jgi:hypothetical protein
MIRGLIAAGMVLCTVAGPVGAVGRLVDLTVYDRTERRTLTVHHHEGRHYIVGKPGNEYQIRVRNRSGGDILSVVSVDGVNAVSGETAAWHLTGYILGRHLSFDIKGWRKSLERVAAFFFTEHHNSYAARTGRPDNVGVIGVAVFRRKAELPAPVSREDGPYPGSADAAAADGGSSRQAEGSADAGLPTPYPEVVSKSPSLGTGHGRSRASHVTYASFERATPEPEEVIAIHYDTHSNLVAMGIIRAPRIATPFPGPFVPDPR